MKKRVFSMLGAGIIGLTASWCCAETVVQTSTGAYVVTPATPAVVAPAVVAPAAAQPVNVQVNNTNNDDHEKKSWGQLEFSGGKALMQGSSKDYLGDSWAADLGIFGPLGRAGQMGMEFTYLFGSDVGGTLPSRLTPTIGGTPVTQPGAGTVKAHIMSATPELRLGPQLKAGNVGIMPYIEGGGGFYWTHYNTDSIDFTEGSASLPSENDYNGGWNAGGGITIGLTPGIGIQADVKYHDIVYREGPDTRFLLPEGKLVILF
jgi:opacity protein-like surface antigen